MAILLIVIVFAILPLLTISIWIISEINGKSKTVRIVNGIICIIISCLSIYCGNQVLLKNTNSNYRSSFNKMLVLLKNGNKNAVCKAIEKYIDSCNKGHSQLRASSILESNLVKNKPMKPNTDK